MTDILDEFLNQTYCPLCKNTVYEIKDVDGKTEQYQ